MTPKTDWPVFDGHNDCLLSLYLPKEGEERSFFTRSPHGHIDLPRMREGGLGGGLFAVFAPSQEEEDRKHPGVEPGGSETSYDLPMPAAINLSYAQKIAMKGIAYLYRIETEADGQLRIIRTADELETCLQQGIIAAVLHFEGAEAIDPDLDALHVFYQAGLRSLGIAWSRPNAFAHGVPFKFPHTPDTGPGLTEAGQELVKVCNQLGVAVDLAHINAKGFWDVVKLTDAPLVVSHAGVHAVCPSTRNLTDKQLDAIGESQGIVGVNFHVAFVRSDGQLNQATPLQEIVRHIDYIADRIGIDCVALGSDFDGATMPEDLEDAARLPKLIETLQDNGYDDKALRKLTHTNWLRVLRQTWK